MQMDGNRLSTIVGLRTKEKASNVSGQLPL